MSNISAHLHLAGKRFGRWTALRLVDRFLDRWQCRCDCGGRGEVAAGVLLAGRSKSCGCLRKEKAKRNIRRARAVRLELRSSADKQQSRLMIGRRFGTLKVLSSADRKDRRYWHVRCKACGREFDIAENSLKRLKGKRNCGCTCNRGWKPHVWEKAHEVHRARGQECRERAVESLRGILSDGPMLRAVAFAKAREKGVSHRNIRHAVGELQVECSSAGRGNLRQWSLQPLDLIGKKYGKLTVIRRGKSCNGRTLVCRCDCGKGVTVAQSRLLSGHTASCGCLRGERLASLRNPRTGQLQRMAAGSASAYQEKEPAANGQRPLTETEQSLVDCIRQKSPLQTKEIVAATGLPNNSYLRSTLARLRKDAIIAHGPDGYYLPSR